MFTDPIYNGFAAWSTFVVSMSMLIVYTAVVTTSARANIFVRPLCNYSYLLVADVN